MLNLVRKAPVVKANTAYLSSFNQAVMNFEQYIIEERIKLGIPGNKKTGARPGSRIS